MGFVFFMERRAVWTLFAVSRYVQRLGVSVEVAGCRIMQRSLRRAALMSSASPAPDTEGGG